MSEFGSFAGELLVPERTTRIRVVHTYSRTFRWMFLLELCALLVCCMLFIPVLLIAMFVGDAPDLDPTDVLGRAWFTWHHVQVGCHDEQAELHLDDRVVESSSQRDGVVRAAMGLAEDRDLEFEQVVNGRVVYRRGDAPIPPALELEAVPNGLRWVQELGGLAWLLSKVGLWSPMEVTLTLDEHRLELEFGEGPLQFDRQDLLAVRWGPSLSAGQSVRVSRDQLVIVGRHLTEHVDLPTDVGRTMASFLQRGMREPCDTSSSS